MNRLDRPVFVLGVPAAGVEPVHAALVQAADAFVAGIDDAIAAHPGWQPALRGWDSERLTNRDAEPELVTKLEQRLLDAAGGRLVESVAAGALRLSFLAAAFPAARFVVVRRERAGSLAEATERWRDGDSVTHPDLPGWDGPPWSLALTPQWRALAGKPLAEVVAGQWEAATKVLDTDERRVDPQRVIGTSFEQFEADSSAEVERLLAFIDSAPQRGAPSSSSPFRSVSAGGFSGLLGELGATLLVSTYQTNRLVALRGGREGEGLNTHLRELDQPMGLAYADGRLAVGTRAQLWEYRNVPDVAAKLNPPGSHDACFVPARSTYTGDIRIHDVAWAGDQLWLVATRFSCLATLDALHSFVPRWKPPFITALAAEDRCHLNGLAVVDDEVRWVTALGETDSPGGWREKKASGGVLIDVRSGETAVGGLSMPHSPRHHRGRLWMLESGEGALCVADPQSGTVERVALLPGFTRGLAFAGHLAFVGLSQVREATTFGGLPLTARLEDRQSGVWVVDIDTGTIVAFLRFEDAVQEIFEVCLLPGMRHPEIAEVGSAVADDSFLVPSLS